MVIFSRNICRYKRVNKSSIENHPSDQAHLQAGKEVVIVLVSDKRSHVGR